MIYMFFDNNNFSVNLLYGLELEWGKKNDFIDIRPHHVLSYRITGNATFTYNDTSFNIQGGDVVFVPKNCAYSIEAEQERVLVIGFTSSEPMSKYIKTFSTPKGSHYYEELFQKFCITWKEKRVGYIHECKSIFYKILSRIERDCELSKFDKREDILLKVLEYIHSNFTNPQLSITQLAKFCNVSDTYFRKLFLEKYHVTPLAYINNLKLHYATNLLQANFYSVSEIAEQCGFNNVYYFSRFIRKQTGMSPTELRNSK